MTHARTSPSARPTRCWSRRAQVILTGAAALAGVLAGNAATPPAASAATTTTAASAAISVGSTASRTVGMADPAADRVPAVAYAPTCYASRAAAAGAACQRLLVTDIDTARAREGVRPLVLPRGYATLPATVQVFVVTDLERVDRGLAPLTGVNATLSAQARVGAAAGLDPAIARWDLGGEAGRIWTANQVSDANALEADWLWMYTDGWDGSRTTNVDCTGAHGSGCWGHRHNVLARYPGAPVLVTGTAAIATGVFTSYAQLTLAGTGRTPKLTYTWARALASGADHR